MHIRKVSKSSQRDIKMLCLTLLIGGLAAIANAAVAPNQANEMQQLTNEKLQLISINRQQQAVIANDLLEQPDAALDTVPAERRHLHLQQQQQQQQQKLVSQSVINGNHATYVEPPADFKPIIYDYDKQEQRYHRLESQSAAPSQLPNESPDSSSLNHLMPSNLGSLAQQQQLQIKLQQQQQQQVPPLAAEDPLMISSDSANSELHRYRQSAIPKQQQASYSELLDTISGSQTETQSSSLAVLKPSIGRWSDWHDMSIEPDLASSDSQTNFQSVQHYAIAQQAPYKTRYKSRPAADTKSAIQLGARQPIGGEEQKPELISGNQVPLSAIAGKRLPAHSWSQPSAEFQIKGGQQAASQSSSAATSGSIKGSNLPLNLISSEGNKMVKMKMQQNSLNQQQHVSGKAAPSVELSQSQAQVKQPHANNNQQPHPHPQRRHKRRRKSKTNAEVRIQRLVAASQQLELQAKQVNGLAHNQHPRQHQYMDQENLTDETKRQINSNFRQPHGDLAEQRVSASKQRPPLIVKRFGAPTNSTSHKQIRRRRIKTLLPVGLSTWFLGGIRDLDGRHWQLPAEVVSRLAINDVDLSTHQPAKVGPPAADSVIMITAQSVDHVGVSPTTTPKDRMPINQLIPR